MRYLNWSTQTEENIFNGYSGYTPEDWSRNAEYFKKLDNQALNKMYVLGINYIIIHKDLIAEDNRKEYTDNISLLRQGIVYQDERVEVIDLEKYKFQGSICTARDIKFEIKSLTFPLVISFGTTFQIFPKITLINPKNCYIVNKFMDRYSNIDLMLVGKKQNIQIKLPIIIEPFEKININLPY